MCFKITHFFLLGKNLKIRRQHFEKQRKIDVFCNFFKVQNLNQLTIYKFQFYIKIMPKILSITYLKIIRLVKHLVCQKHEKSCVHFSLKTGSFCNIFKVENLNKLTIYKFQFYIKIMPKILSITYLKIIRLVKHLVCQKHEKSCVHFSLKTGSFCNIFKVENLNKLTIYKFQFYIKIMPKILSFTYLKIKRLVKHLVCQNMKRVRVRLSWVYLNSH